MKAKLNYTNFIIKDLVDKNYFSDLGLNVFVENDLVHEFYLQNGLKVDKKNDLFFSEDLSRLIVITCCFLMCQSNFNFISLKNKKDIHFNLDTKLCDLLPEWCKKNIYYKQKNKVKKCSNEITLKNLVTFTSGLPKETNKKIIDLYLQTDISYNFFSKQASKINLDFNPGSYLQKGIDMVILACAINNLLANQDLKINNAIYKSFDELSQYVIKNVFCLQESFYYDGKKSFDNFEEALKIDLIKERYVKSKLFNEDINEIKEKLDNLNKKDFKHFENNVKEETNIFYNIWNIRSNVITKINHGFVSSLKDITKIIFTIQTGFNSLNKNIFNLQTINLFKDNIATKKHFYKAKKYQIEFFYESGFSIGFNKKITKSVPYLYELNTFSLLTNNGKLILFNNEKKVLVVLSTNNWNIDFQLLLKIGETIFFDMKLEKIIF